MFLKLCSFLSLMDSRFKVRSTCSRQQEQLFTISSVKRESWSNFRYFNFFGKYLLTSEYPKNAALPKSTPPSCWHCEREKTVLKNAFRFFGISHKKNCQFSNITLDCWYCKIHTKPIKSTLSVLWHVGFQDKDVDVDVDLINQVLC